MVWSPGLSRSDKMVNVIWEPGDGKKLDLRIAGYQFPAMIGRSAGENDWDDANWLMIAGKVTVGFGDSWSFAEPCMTVFDAERLGVWLALVADGGRPDDLGFLEPCLVFAVSTDGDVVTVVVSFSHEAVSGRREGGPVDLAFTMALGQVKQAAADWVEDVARFPPR